MNGAAIIITSHVSHTLPSSTQSPDSMSIYMNENDLKYAMKLSLNYKVIISKLLSCYLFEIHSHHNTAKWRGEDKFLLRKKLSDFIFSF